MVYASVTLKTLVEFPTNASKTSPLFIDCNNYYIGYFHSSGNQQPEQCHLLFSETKLIIINKGE